MKDAGQRQDAMLSLLGHGATEHHSLKEQVYKDVVPYMVHRLTNEQENVKMQVLPPPLGRTVRTCPLFGLLPGPFQSVASGATHTAAHRCLWMIS